MSKLILYHGSPEIIQTPVFGKGKSYNDYGKGFYCTEHLELAKEWACDTNHGGYANKYALDIDFELEPPLFEITETHYAATWLLHPHAPKVEMPKIIKERIERMTKGRE